MTTKCTGLAGRIFGHKFFPVITKGKVDIQRRVEGITEAGYLRLAEMSRDETCHHSVCQRCGAVTGEKK